MSQQIKIYDGDFVSPPDGRFAVVASLFNHLVVDRLLEGALDTLQRHGVTEDRLVVAKVPGAWELPLVCRRLATSGSLDAIVALGAVIRGATAHFDYVAGEAARGCAKVMLDTGVPVSFGVLTTDTLEQALERAGSKAGNKGSDAALAALHMVSLGRSLAMDDLA